MLSQVTSQEALKHLALQFGFEPDTVETLSDLIRAEVHARGHAPRATTLSRIKRMLVPALSVDEEVLSQICNMLEREGDILMTPGGVLYATPTRVVTTEKQARVFSSVPTHVLAPLLKSEISASGAKRSTASNDKLEEAIAMNGGAMITPSAWAGLDRAQPADDNFLKTLDQRLEWQALSAGSLETDGALEWRTWQATTEGMRWRRSNDGRLWWARARFGGHHRAWTANGPPSTSLYVELSADDADRARFALSRSVTGACSLFVENSDAGVMLEVPGWLPRPEYRWLSLHAQPVLDTKGLKWLVAEDDKTMITTMLTERLGLVMEAR